MKFKVTEKVKEKLWHGWMASIKICICMEFNKSIWNWAKHSFKDRRQLWQTLYGLPRSYTAHLNPTSIALFVTNTGWNKKAACSGLTSYKSLCGGEGEELY